MLIFKGHSLEHREGDKEKAGTGWKISFPGAGFSSLCPPGLELGYNLVKRAGSHLSL